MDTEQCVQAIRRSTDGSPINKEFHDQASHSLQQAINDENPWHDVDSVDQSPTKHTSSLDAGPAFSLPSDEGTSQALRTDSTDEGPQVDSVRDLHTLCEVLKVEDDQIVFSHSTFSFIDNDDMAYYGQAFIRKKLLSSQDLKEGLKRVPDEEIYPEAPSHIKTVSTPVKGDVYVKRPKLTTYEDVVGTTYLSKLFLEEAETLELLMRKPHANLVRYHGCLVKRGRITGLVLDRHPITLEHRLQDGARNSNKEACIEGIASAVKHLHSLGLAHNDLNPANIMLDENDAPVIIDFGSCQPFGKDLISAGTPGWVDEDFTTSEQRHDEIALGKIRTWMDEVTAS